MADRNYYRLRKEYLQKKEEESQVAKRKEEILFGGRTEIEDHGLFGDNTASGDQEDDTDKGPRKAYTGIGFCASLNIKALPPASTYV